MQLIMTHITVRWRPLVAVAVMMGAKAEVERCNLYRGENVCIGLEEGQQDGVPY